MIAMCYIFNSDFSILEVISMSETTKYIQYELNPLSCTVGPEGDFGRL